jgi:hypothetical protein
MRICFPVLFLVAGCATTLSPYGERVVELKTPAAAHCEYLGLVSASTGSGALASINDISVAHELRNKAGMLGANLIVSSVHRTGNGLTTNGSYGQGHALFCEQQGLSLNSNCQSGDSDSCLQYSEYLKAKGLFGAAVQNRKLACRLENQKACVEQEAFESKIASLQAKCEKGKAKGCSEYGRINGALGNESLGKTYLSKGCKLGDSQGCTDLAYVEQAERDQASLRERRAQAELVQQTAALAESYQNAAAAQQRLYNMQSLLILNSMWNSEPSRTPSQQIRCSTRPIFNAFGDYVRSDTECR